MHFFVTNHISAITIIIIIDKKIMSSSSKKHQFDGRTISWYAMMEPQVQSQLKADVSLAQCVNNTKAQIYEDSKNSSLESCVYPNGLRSSRVLGQSSANGYRIIWVWEKMHTESKDVANYILNRGNLISNPNEQDPKDWKLKIKLKPDMDRILHILDLVDCGDHNKPSIQRNAKTHVIDQV
jgi:hypothetical protein